MVRGGVELLRARQKADQLRGIVNQYRQMLRTDPQRVPSVFERDQRDGLGASVTEKASGVHEPRLRAASARAYDACHASRNTPIFCRIAPMWYARCATAASAPPVAASLVPACFSTVASNSS